MTIYIQCGHCGTMKPCGSDPDDELERIRLLFYEHDADMRHKDGSLRSAYHLVAGHIDAMHALTRAYVDQVYEIKALRAALPEGYVVNETTAPIAGDGGSDAPRQLTMIEQP